MVQNLSRSRGRFGRRFVALLAIQMGTQILVASGDSENPRPTREWRLMTYVLSMTTGQIGNPIAVVVLVVSNDRLLHIVMILVLQEERWNRHTMIRSLMRFLQRFFWVRANINVSRTAVLAAEQRKNTSIAFPHLGRSFL